MDKLKHRPSSSKHAKWLRLSKSFMLPVTADKASCIRFIRELGKDYFGKRWQVQIAETNAVTELLMTLEDYKGYPKLQLKAQIAAEENIEITHITGEVYLSSYLLFYTLMLAPIPALIVYLFFFFLPSYNWFGCIWFPVGFTLLNLCIYVSWRNKVLRAFKKQLQLKLDDSTLPDGSS
jgi:hypothetical protein